MEGDGGWLRGRLSPTGWALWAKCAFRVQPGKLGPCTWCGNRFIICIGPDTCGRCWEGVSARRELKDGHVGAVRTPEITARQVPTVMLRGEAQEGNL